MVRRILTVLVVSVLTFTWALPAYAELSPTTRWKLSSYKRNANPQVIFKLSQDAGEEELAKVVLALAPGFKLAPDKAIKDNELLGEGHITIAAGPGCVSGNAEATFPFEVDATLREKNRNAQQKKKGVWARWVLEIPNVTTVPIIIKGTPKKGLKAHASIEANDFTCPPFSFRLTLFKRSETSKAKIWRNPYKPGRYTLKVIYTGEEGSKKTYRQTVRIRR